MFQRRTPTTVNALIADYRNDPEPVDKERERDEVVASKPALDATLRELEKVVTQCDNDTNTALVNLSFAKTDDERNSLHRVVEECRRAADIARGKALTARYQLEQYPQRLDDAERMVVIARQRAKKRAGATLGSEFTEKLFLIEKELEDLRPICVRAKALRDAIHDQFHEAGDMGSSWSQFVRAGLVELNGTPSDAANRYYQLCALLELFEKIDLDKIALESYRKAS